MTAEILTVAVIGTTAGFVAGYMVKHIQDTKYLNEMERFTEKSVGVAVKNATKKMAIHDRKIMEQMLKRIEWLEKENRNLKQPDFFQDIPADIDQTLDISFLENV